MDRDDTTEEKNREADIENIANQGSDAIPTLRKYRRDTWEELAEQTVLTQRQIEMWDLAIVQDQKNGHISYHSDIGVTTIARHCERVRSKRDSAEEKIAELRERIQKWENTLEYFEETSTMDR